MEISCWEANSHSIKKFPNFYGAQCFITIFTRSCHWSLHWARWIQSTPSQPIFLRLVTTLFSQLRVVPSNWYISFRFSNQHFIRISHLSRGETKPLHNKIIRACSRFGWASENCEAGEVSQLQKYPSRYGIPSDSIGCAREEAEQVRLASSYSVIQQRVCSRLGRQGKVRLRYVTSQTVNYFNRLGYQSHTEILQ